MGAWVESVLRLRNLQSNLTYSVGEGCLLQMRQKLQSQLGKIRVVSVHNLLPNRVNNHAALSGVIDKKVARLTIIVCSDLVKVTLENDAKLCREHLVLPLICCNFHHLDELRRGVFLNL